MCAAGTPRTIQARNHWRQRPVLEINMSPNSSRAHIVPPLAQILLPNDCPITRSLIKRAPVVRRVHPKVFRSGGFRSRLLCSFVGNKMNLLPDQGRHANGPLGTEDRAQRRTEPHGGDPPITDKLVPRLLQDLIPTKLDFTPTPETSKRRTIHINDLSE
ncbi:hypothetical protein OPQ81_009187 [Rhizoctonia solani]|nr:hypothetical protein OPQ81_009187 [Rhizoctonia solani]